MAHHHDTKQGQQKHDKARDLAERAIDRAADGDMDQARSMADQARSLDKEATEEVADRVEQERRRAEKHKPPQ